MFFFRFCFNKPQTYVFQKYIFKFYSAYYLSNFENFFKNQRQPSFKIKNKIWAIYKITYICKIQKRST